MEAIKLRTAVFDFTRTYIVGILNVTPDSFSDGGRFVALDAALAHAERLEREGADVIDVGGESTRPGAQPVPAAEERRRVVPVIEALARQTRLPLSIDTYKAEVARAALDAGCEIVNDVSGGRLDRALLDVAATAGAVLVAGHMRGEPATMQDEVAFRDTFAEVAEELAERVVCATEAGIARIVVDPGIGFGKNTEHNVELLRRAADLRQALRRPIMVGTSRKAFLGALAQVPRAEARVCASAVAAALSARLGADFVRVHDVAETRQAIAVAAALLPGRPAEGEREP
jgi:dihydropteroate synthase